MIICMITMLTWYISEKMVFDIDSIREDYRREMQMAYMRGCERGTDYPQEYKMPTGFFNPNSPPSWCGEQSKSLEEYVQVKSCKIGK